MNSNHYNAERLQALRQQKSLAAGKSITQQAVADALGVQRQTVYRAERGENISYEMLCALAAFYNVEVISLLHPIPLDCAQAA